VLSTYLMKMCHHFRKLVVCRVPETFALCILSSTWQRGALPCASKLYRVPFFHTTKAFFTMSFLLAHDKVMSLSLLLLAHDKS
jgi:hypothetical protein